MNLLFLNGLSYYTLPSYFFIITKGKSIRSSNDGMAWHHIVEQNADNIAKFGAEKIHNTQNLIRLPNGKGSIHAKISGYYSSIYQNTGMRVRDYVNTLSYDEQYKFGIEILKRFGWKP